MISKKEFTKLRHGDVVKINNVFRTVLIGPSDHKNPNWHCGLKLPIRCRSWTGRAVTTKCYHDIKHILSTTGRRNNRFLINKEEAFRLINSGFNIRKAVRYETTNPFGTLGPGYVNPLICKTRKLKLP